MDSISALYNSKNVNDVMEVVLVHIYNLQTYFCTIWQQSPEILTFFSRKYIILICVCNEDIIA